TNHAHTPAHFIDHRRSGDPVFTENIGRFGHCTVGRYGDDARRHGVTNQQAVELMSGVDHDVALRSFIGTLLMPVEEMTSIRLEMWRTPGTSRSTVWITCLRWNEGKRPVITRVPCSYSSEIPPCPWKCG